MKKIALFAIVCCAMVFTSCNRGQHAYYTTTNFEFSDNDNVIRTEAVLGTINLYWNGEYTFNGDNTGYTDVKAKAKYIESRTAIIAHGNELKANMGADDVFYYKMYRKEDNVLLESTKFYLNADGNFAYEIDVDNVEE